MISEDILRLVNHEVWIEIERKRAYLKWGHFPETDGKIDPQCIKRAFVIDPYGKQKALTIGIDKDASSKGGLFLEFNTERDGIYTIVIEYDRGIYTVTKDDKWIFGEKNHVINIGYDVKESRWICGIAKTYFVVGDYEKSKVSANLEFEIVPEIIRKFKNGEMIKIQLLFRGNPIKESVNVRQNSKLITIETDSSGFAELELVKGINVISSRYIDKLTKVPGVYDMRTITTTLTILVD